MLITKKEKLLFLLVLVLAVALSGTIYINYSKSSQLIFESNGESGETEEKETLETKEKENEIKMIGIHIAGCVKNPGFIWIEEGKRLYDAINYIGGVLPEADLDMINLSKVLCDEEKIYIPGKGELDNPENIAVYSISNTSVTGKQSGNNDKVNINTADETQFETLPGIGPVLAKRIVEHRINMGMFKSIDDIRSVSGIGEKRFEDIKDLIIVR